MRTLRAFAGLLVLGALVLTPLVALTYPGGAPAGTAGDISTSIGLYTCATSGCHNSFDLDSGSGGVSIQAPGQFTPGETVEITVAVDNQTTPAAGSERRQGFEAAVKDPVTGEHVGSLQILDPANTHPAQGNASYVTHTEDGTASASWTFTWTAPTADVPSTVRVYAAGNAADGDGSTSGDHIYTMTADITAASVAASAPPEPLAFDLGVPVPNPVRGDEARVTLRLRAPADVSVRLVDGRGREVRHVARVRGAPGTHPVAVPIRGLAPGLYFVIAEANGETRTQAISVVR